MAGEENSFLLLDLSIRILEPMEGKGHRYSFFETNSQIRQSWSLDVQIEIEKDSKRSALDV